jgi:hypothetical protein
MNQTLQKVAIFGQHNGKNLVYAFLFYFCIINNERNIVQEFRILILV